MSLCASIYATETPTSSLTLVVLLSPITTITATSVTPSLYRTFGNTISTEPPVTKQEQKKPCISNVSLARSVQNRVDDIPLFGITGLWPLTIVTIEPSIVPLHTPTLSLPITATFLTKATIHPSELSVVMARVVSTNVTSPLRSSPSS